ncbi:uncharacterized protein LOC103313913 isoform X2 [Tribolium castaneum]|uniref:uncharacterized protein LOC103313913 isoform X2 n=1 Tax=Tribolium castaneum TaxID=7070 RepID=UPI00046C1474|nr:PREDICTED: uncharacterized protein LOC103313913 isoform X2 [Tribolium castaneum]|eukprot:XP_008196641.1 PREDICTED: uncharacterized protein LOC103313913 isoform X2 [Tribolium castaneum]
MNWVTHCSTDSADYQVFNLKGSSIKLAKWQTEPFTERVLQQLNDEPKVILSSVKNNKSFRNVQRTDHNVPDLCDIGNYVECSTHEDIIYTSEKCVKLPDDGGFFFDIEEKTDNAKKHDVEKELSIMFQNVTTEEETAIKKPSHRRRQHKPKKTKNLRELLIQLFGSPLDDIEKPPKTPQKVQNNRRQSLPVSIQIAGADFFKPVKINNKRKSEADIPSCKKVQKTVQVPVLEVFNVDYLSVAELKIPPIYSETATSSVTLEELKVATVLYKPRLSKTQTVTNTHIIDLTQDSSNSFSSTDIPVEIKGEQANVGLSMPSLSPLEEGAKSRPETTSVQPPKTVEKMVATTQRRQSVDNVQSQPNTRIQINRQQSAPQLQQAERPIRAQQTALEQLMEWRKNQIQPPSQPHWISNEHNMPQLLRIHQNTPSGYLLISNRVCGEKIFPYVYKYYVWKQKLVQLMDLKKSLFSADEVKENLETLASYYEATRRNIAKRLIKELLPLEIFNFVLSDVLSTISTKMVEKQLDGGLCRVCCLIHNIMQGFEDACITPFTKRFYSVVSASMGRLDERSRHVFTSQQLKLLELQITQFHLIQCWINARAHAANQRPKSPKTNKRKTTVIQSNPAKRNERTIVPRILVHSKENVQSTLTPKPPELPPYRSYNQGPLVNVSRPQETNNVTFRMPQETSIFAFSRPQIPILPRPPPPQQVAETQQTNIVPRTPETNVSTSFTRPQELTLRSLLNSQARPQEANTEQGWSKVPERVPTVQSTETKEPQTAEATAEEARKDSDDVIDLTWIDDADEKAIYDEIIECKVFEFKDEFKNDNNAGETSDREVVSPADSGLGSPVEQTDDGFKCLCGNRAIYVCACKSSMYCSQECQVNDWTYHQKMCNKTKS